MFLLPGFWEYIFAGGLSVVSGAFTPLDRLICTSLCGIINDKFALQQVDKHGKILDR
jgi:hypothetical protein